MTIEKWDFNTEETEDTETNKDLSRRCIGDFPENGGAARACGGRKIRRAMMKRFISKKSEGEGFLGVFEDAETGGRQDFDSR